MSREIASDEQIKHWARQLNGGKPTYGQLQEELSASKDREAALASNYHSLAAIVHEAADTLGIPQGHVLERAIAVKARIKASQEQEPIAYLNIAVWKHAGYDSVFATPERGFDNQDALYAQPPIPPELAELQREIERLHKDVTYYSEKLTEVTRRHCDAIDNNAELRKLLESKVPEGWQLVPKNPTEEMDSAGRREFYSGESYAGAIYASMLAAAPQPKELKQ